MAGSPRETGRSGILHGVACVLTMAFCGACAGASGSVGGHRAPSIPRTAVNVDGGDTALVIAGEEYAAGKVRQLLGGEHYRDLWAAPIRVPVLNLSTFAGGLTPLRQGGGRQTLSLRLEAADGRQFVFRTVAKNHREILPENLRGSPVGDILQDQVSSMNPAGALVVDDLAHALGVHHAHPLLVLAPDDERLGAFRSAFAGRLGLLEEYPVAGRAGSAVIAGADRIVSTGKLFEILDRHGGARVDARSYLTARLLDMVVGDWDRHAEQWRWARRRTNGRDVYYYPLPRDRDQAFARLDGLIPRIVDSSVRQMVSFSDDLEDVSGLMYSGRIIDRRILADLDKPAWDAVAAFVAGALTDEVIEAAVRRMPAPYHALRGAWLAAALKSRRDRLEQASERFRRVVAASGPPADNCLEVCNNED